MTINGRRKLEESASSPPPSNQALPERLARAAPPGRPGSARPHAAALPNYSGAENDARLLELWLADKATETKRQYVQDLEKFFDFSGGNPVSSVTLAELQEVAVVNG